HIGKRRALSRHWRGRGHPCGSTMACALPRDRARIGHGWISPDRRRFGEAAHLVSCPRNKHVFRCDQNAPPARREEGAYPERSVTDEQRSRRPIFIATFWAAASWLFFRVARSSRIDLDMLVARALKNSQLTCGERHAYFGDRTVARKSQKQKSSCDFRATEP